MSGLGDLPALLQRGDWSKAEALLRQAAARRDAPAAVFYNLAKVLIEAGKPAQAGAWFRKAVARDPGHAAAWFELGRWHLERGEVAEALEPFRRAAQLAPADRDAQISLGRTALRLGKWEVARAAWERAPGPEADRALYRIAAETGAADADTRRAQLLAQGEDRAEVLKALTRTAKGRLPLALPPLDDP